MSIEMACPQHQSAMNARKHLFLRVKSAAAGMDLWQVCAEFFGHHLTFFCAASLAAGPYLWMGGPIAPSTPESDLWDAALLVGLMAPQKH